MLPHLRFSLCNLYDFAVRQRIQRLYGKYGNEAFVPDKAREIALQSHRAKLTGPQSCDATNSQAEFNQLSRHALTVSHARHKTMCAAMSPGHLLPLENFRERPGGMVRLAPQQLINTNGVFSYCEHQ